MVMYLYITDGKVAQMDDTVSLDSIFQCDFRSDGHMTLYIMMG